MVHVRNLMWLWNMSIDIKVSGSLGQSKFNSIQFFGQNYLTACNKTTTKIIVSNCMATQLLHKYWLDLSCNTPVLPIANTSSFHQYLHVLTDWLASFPGSTPQSHGLEVGWPVRLSFFFCTRLRSALAILYILKHSGPSRSYNAWLRIIST